MGSVLVADREHIQLLPASITTDIAEFESLLLAARQADKSSQSIALLTQAHALYRGDLLPGIDRNLEEAWVNVERDRLRQSFYKSLLYLADLIHAQGDASAAIALAQRALKVDAQQEEAHEHLMRLYAAQGKFDVVARQYKKLETILHDTLQIAPSPFVQEVYRDIKRHPEKYIRQYVHPDARSDKNSAQSPTERNRARRDVASIRSPAVPPVTAFPSNTMPFLSPNTLPPSFADFVLPLPTCRTHFYGRQTELQQILPLLDPSDASEQTDSEAEDTAQPRSSPDFIRAWRRGQDPSGAGGCISLTRRL